MMRRTPRGRPSMTASCSAASAPRPRDPHLADCQERQRGRLAYLGKAQENGICTDYCNK